MTAVPSDLMTAAVYVGDGQIAVEQVPVPESRPGELLVEVAECGICGSDLHLVLDRYAKPGAILGHEWSGTCGLDRGRRARQVHRRAVSSSTRYRGAGRADRAGGAGPSVCLQRKAFDIRDMRGAFAQYIIVASANTLASRTRSPPVPRHSPNRRPSPSTPCTSPM